MLPVNTKQDFLKRYLSNEFGNRLGVWSTKQDYLNDPMKIVSGLFGLRPKMQSDTCPYDLPINEIMEKWNDNTHYLSQCAPDDKLLLQGYIGQLGYLNNTGGFEFLYSNKSGYRMRDGLSKFGKIVRGSQVKMFDIPDEVYELLDLYPGHIVEFSTYRTRCGIFNKKHIIWEVRNY